jgi:lysophospholipase L1-like esterase
MSDSWSTTENNWADVNINIKDTESDFSIKDEDNNAIVVFKDGHLQTKNFDSHDLTLGNTQSDLAFKDENNNAIIIFRNGHIKTKNFDSQNIPSSYLLNKFKNKKIAIIGDSICTFAGWLPSNIQGYDGETYATYYPRGDVNSANKTWWYKMAIELGLNPNEDVNNCSWSGSRVTGNSASTSNAYAGCSTRRVTDLSIRGYNPDIIIISISCNDWGNNVSLGNWAVTDAIPAEGNISYARAAYALMINKIHVAYPTAKVFCCTIMDEINRDQTPGWPSNNASGISTYQWNQNIREIASALGCDIIDFHHCGINYSNIADYYAVDQGLHPNDAGHTLMARKAIFELISKY